MNLGMPEMIFIFVLALIIFGPRKLPEVGREIGKALAEFKRASNDFKNQLESEIDQLDVEKQRDYYRSRAEQLAREAQEAFSINPPANAGMPNSDSNPYGRTFAVEGYPPTASEAAAETKAAESVPSVVDPQPTDPVKETNV